MRQWRGKMRRKKTKSETKKWREIWQRILDGSLIVNGAASQKKNGGEKFHLWNRKRKNFDGEVRRFVLDKDVRN